jgi:hypothetical protein
VDTEYPREPKVTLRVAPAADADFELWLRIPAWSKVRKTPSWPRSWTDRTAFYNCIFTGMPGTPCIFWADLTPLLPKRTAVSMSDGAAPPAVAGRYLALRRRWAAAGTTIEITFVRGSSTAASGAHRGRQR